MKTIIFILLKLVEIAGAAVVYWLLGLFGNWIGCLIGDEPLGMWSLFAFYKGVVTILVGVVVLFIIWGIFFKIIPSWLKQNNKWANTIAWKIKDRQGK